MVLINRVLPLYYTDYIKHYFLFVFSKDHSLVKLFFATGTFGLAGIAATTELMHLGIVVGAIAIIGAANDEVNII